MKGGEKMKTIKKLIAVILCILMFCSCVQVSGLDEASLFNSSISNYKCSLTISGINSTSSATMQTSKVCH